MTNPKVERCRKCGGEPIYQEYEGRFNTAIYIKCVNWDCENIDVCRGKTFKDAAKLWNKKQREVKE